MTTLLLNVLKGMLIKLASKAFLEWLLLWVAEAIAASTKTTKDDEFVARVKQELKGD